MKLADIGFNFIELCNQTDFDEQVDNYQLYCVAYKEQIAMDFLPFVSFDDNYDAYYFSSVYNNGAISYFGNSVLSEQELKNIKFVFFQKKIVHSYLDYLKYSKKRSTKERFIHFWLITRHQYKIKVEPCDIFK